MRKVNKLKALSIHKEMNLHLPPSLGNYSKDQSLNFLLCLIKGKNKFDAIFG